jgi:hypothetical protein
VSEVLDDIGAALETAGVGTQGTDLFLSVMPETPDTCVAVVEVAGIEPVDVFRDSAPIIETPRLQVLSRARRADDAKTKARAAWLALAGVGEGTVGGGNKRWLNIDVVQSPFMIGRDENDRVIYGFNAQAWRDV